MSEQGDCLGDGACTNPRCPRHGLPSEQSYISRTVLFRLLDEARAIGQMEGRPLRPSTDHITEMGVQERWSRLVSDARSTLRSNS